MNGVKKRWFERKEKGENIHTMFIIQGKDVGMFILTVVGTQNEVQRN